MSHVVLVSNPKSGSADEETLERVAERLKAVGEVVHVAPGSVDSFGEELDEPVTGAQLVVVAGGDGTLNCTINGLAGRLDGLPLALVPMGTGNDLARTLGLPLDPLEAVDVAADGVWSDLDVGRARSSTTDRLFVNACMGGLPVAVDEAIEGGIKDRLGPFAFWVGGAKVLADLTRYEVRAGEAAWSELLAIGIGNGRTAGGGITVFPDAKVGDGRLELCAMGATSIAEGLKLVAKIRSGEHVELPTVDMRTGQSFTVEAEPQLEFNVDGELVNLVTPVEFSIAARARMKVPT